MFSQNNMFPQNDILAENNMFLEEEILNKDQLNKDQTNKDQPNKDQTNKDQPNKDQTNKDQTNKDQTNKDQPNKDQTNKDQPNKDLSKKDVKVLVVLGDETSGLTATKIKTNEGDKYAGFNYEFLIKIRDKLKDKYNFTIEFTDDKDHNYDSFVQKVADGKYDMCAGMFTHKKSREALINYTTPILIDANSIIHLKDNDPIEEFMFVILDVLKYIISLVVIGFIFGLILFFGDPHRHIHSGRLKNNKFLFFMRSIMTGISSMFGEMGYLAERTSLKIRGVIIAIIIFMIGFTLIMYIQAKMTQLLLTREQTVYSSDNIKNRVFIGFKGYAVVDKIKKYGAKIEYVENMTNQQMIDMYIGSKNKYSGCILSYVDAYPVVEKNDKLIASINFGNEPDGFVLNKSRRELLTDVNMQILELKKNLELNKLCKSYFGDIESIPVCSLK